MKAFRALLAAAAVLAAGAAGPREAAPNLSVILADRPAATLAAYGLFRDPAAQTPAVGVTPYDLAEPLYSDGALKRRFLYLPPGAQVQYRAEGAFAFPVGAVLVKTFALPADLRAPNDNVRVLETRLLVRKRDGWRADTYVWDANMREAVLQVAGSNVEATIVNTRGVSQTFAYAIPNRNQCKGCHAVDNQIGPIGPSAAHLSLAVGASPSTLERWRDAGVIAGAPDAAARTTLTTVDARARAYLDINCAHCHSPKGPANTSGLDLRADQTDPALWGVRKRPIAAGRAAADRAFAIDPGHPDRSILLHRMESVDPGVMMPELGRATVDHEGVALVRRWIGEMDADGRPRQN